MGLGLRNYTISEAYIDELRDGRHERPHERQRAWETARMRDGSMRDDDYVRRRAREKASMRDGVHE